MVHRRAVIGRLELRVSLAVAVGVVAAVAAAGVWWQPELFVLPTALGAFVGGTAVMWARRNPAPAAPGVQLATPAATRALVLRRTAQMYAIGLAGLTAVGAAFDIWPVLPEFAVMVVASSLLEVLQTRYLERRHPGTILVTDLGWGRSDISLLSASTPPPPPHAAAGAQA